MLCVILSFLTALGLPAHQEAIPTSRPGPRLVANLPQPINDREVEWQKWILQASPEQSAQIERLFSNYQGEVDAVFRELQPTIDGLSAEAAQLSISQPLSAAAVDSFERFWKAQLVLRDRIVACERTYLRDLFAILSTAQSQNLYRVQWQRTRARSSHYEREILPARIDLAALVYRIGGRDAALAAESLLIQYETVATPLFDELDQEVTDRQVTLLRMAHEMMFDSNDVALDASTDAGRRRTEEWAGRRRQLLGKQARLQRRIADVNDQFLDQLDGTIEHGLFQLIREQYRHMAYRSLFPDRYSVQNSLEAAIANADASNRQVIVALQNDYQRQLELINEKLMTSNLSWMEKMAATQAAEGYDAYKRMMRELREARMRLHATTASRLRELTDGNESVGLAKALDTQIADIEQGLLQQSSDDFPSM